MSIFRRFWFIYAPLWCVNFSKGALNGTHLFGREQPWCTWYFLNVILRDFSEKNGVMVSRLGFEGDWRMHAFIYYIPTAMTCRTLRKVLRFAQLFGGMIHMVNARVPEGRPQIHHEYGKLEEKKDKKLTTSLSHFFGPWPAGVLSQADKKQAGDTPSRKSLISPGQEWRSHEGHELSRTKELNISFSQGTFQYDFPFPYVSFLEHIWKPAPPWMVTQSPFLNSAYTPSQPYHNQFMESLYITPFRQLLAHHLFAFLCICHGCL